MSTLYTILSLDVWGHTHDACGHVDDSCRCVRELPSGEYEDTDRYCDCEYWVNDSHRVGSLDIVEEADNATIIMSLIESCYLKPGPVSAYTVDWADEELITIQVTETGRPCLQLQKDY